MKTLTTFAAVAALIAGISVASAQSSSMDKSGTMGSSSTHATGTGKFCVKGISRRVELSIRQSLGMSEGGQGKRNLLGAAEQHHRLEKLTSAQSSCRPSAGTRLSRDRAA